MKKEIAFISGAVALAVSAYIGGYRSGLYQATEESAKHELRPEIESALTTCENSLELCSRTTGETNVLRSDDSFDRLVECRLALKECSSDLNHKLGNDDYFLPK